MNCDLKLASLALSLTWQHAVSGASNELAGEETENLVVDLDTVDGSCCRGKRCEPSESTTFFVRSHEQRKAVMDRHEVPLDKQSSVILHSHHLQFLDAEVAEAVASFKTRRELTRLANKLARWSLQIQAVSNAMKGGLN